MNKVVLMGRLTRDPEVRYTQGENSMCIARYTLAVDRRFSRNNNNDGQNADFIPCVAFGKAGEHAEKYYRKGIKVAVSGRIQTGSYTNRDGVKVYTTEVIVEDQEFAESRNASQQGGGSSYSGGNSYGGGSSYGGGNNSYGGGQSGSAQSSGSIDGFMNIPDGIDEELPFT
ncbi:MAG: single-stranded DNA-binding protein [Lachnospiraceae bacterium]|nr:single-stranded DNA-binding protein [Lachnospiraceae bacterium]MBQ4303027.1 single-stranded DNA-binding protein [Lachnospiraceae bacterium]